MLARPVFTKWKQAKKYEKHSKNRPNPKIWAVFVGAAGQIRTADLILTNRRSSFLLSTCHCYTNTKSIDKSTFSFLACPFWSHPKTTKSGYFVSKLLARPASRNLKDTTIIRKYTFKSRCDLVFGRNVKIIWNQGKRYMYCQKNHLGFLCHNRCKTTISPQHLWSDSD